MADTTQVVGTNDKGQFMVNLPRGDVARIDVVDIDFVLQTKSGARLIIPGAAMDAMTATPPAIQFADGPISSADMLASVERVETPATSVPAMSSLTEHELKKSEGNKNVTRDGPEGRKAEVDAAAQEAQSQQVAPLPQGTDSSVDKLVAKADQITTDIAKKAFDPAPIKPFEPPGVNPDSPGSQPPTAKIPLLMALTEGNVVGIESEDRNNGDGGKIIYGFGGPAGSATANGILTSDAAQYGTETLDGGAGSDIIYADSLRTLDNGGNDATTYNTQLNAETGLPTGTPFYYAKEVMFNIAGYIRRVDSITLSGLPTGVTVEGATLSNGVWTIPNASAVPTAKAFNIVYDVTALRAQFAAGADFVDFEVTFNVKGFGVEPINAFKTFVLRFQDVDSSTDITNNNPIFKAGGWSDIYVMPTASAPHLINAGGGDNLVYAGNSNDTINAGAGADTIYAYAGNDTISVGDGANIIWAGNGDDRVTTGSGNDIINAGAGNDTVTAGAGNDVIDGGSGDDVITAGTGNNAITGGAGADTLSFADAGITSVTLTLNANGDLSGAMSRSDGGTDTITGMENIIGSSGADIITFTGSGDVANTVWGGGGDDIINAGDGNDTVHGEADNDTIYGGTGNDVVYGGNGTDTITGGTGTDSLYGEAGDDVFLTNLADGADIYNGGDGTDKVDYTAETAGLTINLSNGTTGSGGSATGDTYTDVEWIVGGSAGDTLTGSSSTVILEGGAGDDYLVATGGSTTLYGDVRNTDMSSGSSTGSGGALLTNWSNPYGWQNNSNGTNWSNPGYSGDRLIGSNTGTTTMYGGSGYNQYTLQTEIDVVVGGTNNATDFDRITYSNQTTLYGDVATTGMASSGVFINIDTVSHTWDNSGTVDNGVNGYWWNGTTWTLMTGTIAFNSVNANSGQYGWAASDTYNDIEQVIGTRYADVIFGNDEGNYINAGDGNDAVFGMGGDDWIFGVSTGNDRIDGGSNTAVTLANGGDIVDYSGCAASLVVNLDRANGSVTGKTANNNTTIYTVKLVYVEGFIGGNLNDDITGSSGADRIDGRGGADTVNAGAGADIVYAGWGTKSIASGPDVLNGGTGAGTDGSADSDWVSYSGLGEPGNGGLGIEVYLADADLDGNGQQDQATTWGANQIYQSRYNTGGTYEYDTLTNFENVEGSAYNDRIAGNTGANILSGLAGNDTIDGGNGDDTIDGGVGDDVLKGGAGTNTLSYASITVGGVIVDLAASTMNATSNATNNAGTDTISNFRHVRGSAGNDTLSGDANANSLSGDAGDDVLKAGDGSDVLDGGAHATLGDTVDFSAWVSAAVVDLSAATVSVVHGLDTLTLTGIENLRGTGLADTLTGDDNNNTIDGGAGDDGLAGGNGNDTLSYTSITVGGVNVNLSTGVMSATSVAVGNAGTDTITSFENIIGTGLADTLTGDGNNNTIDGGAGNDVLDGGGGSDTLSYASITVGGVNVNLTTNIMSATSGAAGNAGTDTITNFENIIGTGAADTLTGDGNSNTIDGGAGNDIISGGTGDDYLDGGIGTDTVTYASAGGPVTVNLATHAASGALGTDAIWNFENITGGGSNDILTGDGTANAINGGAGADVMTGAAGNDTYYVDNAGDTAVEAYGQGTDTVNTTISYTLTDNVENLTAQASGLTLTGNVSDNSFLGSNGVDSIYGEAGNDIINGNGGADILSGGVGDDTFTFTTATLTAASVIDGGAGTDTINCAAFTLNDLFSDAKFESIEVINAKGAGAILMGTATALTYDKLADILDVTDNGTLTLKLDNGDYFNTNNSNSATGPVQYNSATSMTYDYASGANTLHVQVQWS